jgi:predicted AlkP superfamily pyrophosphatase or phosphodiesterase
LLFLFSSFVHSDENIVIVISLDGLRFDYLERTETEAFSYITKEGARASSLVPVYQSSTFPTHVTMATGVTPDLHGILHNSFYDKERGSFSYSPDASWIQSEPVWSIVENQDIKTATYFWVGSETDWRETSISYSKAPFNGRISEKEKLDQILEWLDMDIDLRPRLIMSWWHGTDSVAHQKGATHPDVFKQLNKQDKILFQLIEEITRRNIWDKVTLLVVSDHGMSDVSNFINLKEILKLNSIDARISTGPAVAHIFLDKKEELKRAISSLQENQHLSVWSKEDLPKEFNMFNETRTGDVIVTTSIPNMLVTRNNSNPPIGMHGYNPKDNKHMHGIFLAYGNKVANKRLQKVHQLDITPTILDLLNLDVPEYMQGKIIELQ